MSPKRLSFPDTSTARSLPGWTTLEPAIVLLDVGESDGITLGRMGRNVVTEKKWGAPTITNDGVAIASEIELDRDARLEARELLRTVRIEVSPAADVTLLDRRDSKFRYAKVELGMNAVVPKGRIDELRFYVSLKADPSDDIAAVDGYPKSDIEETYVVQGSIRLALDGAMSFVQTLTGAPVPVSLTLEPWQFHLGALRRTHIEYSGSLTPDVEWRFMRSGLNGELRVALILRVPDLASNLRADVQAVYRYDPGVFKRSDVFTRTAVVPIYA